MKERRDQSEVPGTKMNNILKAAATKAPMRRTVVARLFKSFRMYGSRIGAQFIKVYSLYPKMAMTGSSLY